MPLSSFPFRCPIGPIGPIRPICRSPAPGPQPLTDTPRPHKIEPSAKAGDAIRKVNLQNEKLTRKEVIGLTEKEPVLLLTAEGKEFIISEADDFQHEVETLRKSRAFQKFLDRRLASSRRVPLEDIETETARQLAGHKKTA